MIHDRKSSDLDIPAGRQINQTFSDAEEEERDGESDSDSTAVPGDACSAGCGSRAPGARPGRGMAAKPAAGQAAQQHQHET